MVRIIAANRMKWQGISSKQLKNCCIKHKKHPIGCFFEQLAIKQI